jgi:hypothetical protein
MQHPPKWRKRPVAVAQLIGGNDVRMSSPLELPSPKYLSVFANWRMTKKLCGGENTERERVVPLAITL